MSKTTDDKQTTSRLGDVKMIIFQVLLGVNTLLILLVVGVVLKLFPKPTLQASPSPQEEPKTRIELIKEGAVVSDDSGVFSTTSPAWRNAEAAFHKQDYTTARHLYEDLALKCRQAPSEKLLRDYFTLRIAQCLRRTGNMAEARGLFEQVSQSLSPVVRAMGYYGRAAMDLADQRFLAARMNGCRAAGALASLQRETPLTVDCDFLINRALTEKVRTFRSTERFTNWPSDVPSDPFAGLTREQLRELLAEGSSRMAPPMLGPEFKAQRIAGRDGVWQVRAAEVTVEEALNQFGAQADRDVRWVGVDAKVRKRPVDLYCAEVGTQRYCEIAAGSVGLISRFTLEQVLVHDPMNEASANAQMELIAREAISAWRLFFLRHPRESRVPLGHFAIAAISEWRGEDVGAMREYELLARRFEASDVAPTALLRSATIKLKVHDQAGARRDLNDLLDLYPDHPGIAAVYLLLGKATEEANQLNDAALLYERLYHRNFSPESRCEAAYGAGRCHYERGSYEQASTWLARYLALLDQSRGLDYTRGYFLLGRAEAVQGNYSVAAQAFQRGLAGAPEESERVDALLDLTTVRINQERYVMALGVLQRLDREQIAPAQIVRHVGLLSRICREIGIIDRARSYLRMELSRCENPQTRAMVGLELARCHIAGRDYGAARKLLTEIMRDLPDGEPVFDASAMLAEACLKLGEPDQAISVAEPILKRDVTPSVKRRLRRVLGEAWLNKDNYAKATACFAGADLGAQAEEATTAPTSTDSGEVSP
ncbi:MAG: tetratricopeptide repeat protein [Planctomycetes bacterium]|jgi:tetratricopeptide (TPR) repeat protein|nr:tetratricopeptide repeat protein [Phycisphaerae bacterium]NBB95055.1 tetratricopeptide repeat protein [Planctomycetota bacterium]